MISIRQYCPKCDEAIRSIEINHERKLVRCANCDTVSSLYEERSFKHKDISWKIPDDLEYKVEENTLQIDLPNSKLLRPKFNKLGCGFLLLMCFFASLIFGTNITVNGEDQSLGYKITAVLIVLSAIGILIMYVKNYQRPPCRITVNPFNFTIDRCNPDRIKQHFQAESYMVDQLSVKTHGVEKTTTHAIHLLTKQNEMHQIMFGKNEHYNTLKTIELLVETYLGIRDRNVSGE